MSIQASDSSRLQRVSWFLGSEQLAGLREVHRRTGLSVSEHIRRAIDQYLAAWRAGRSGT